MLPRMHADATMSRARCAVPHATPHGPQVLVNQPVTLALPGARAGDLVMIVRQTAQGGCVEAASGGGGVLVTDGELQMRLHDRNLFLHEATYLVCHAFNFSGYLGDQAYHQQGALNVTVSYPIRALEVYDRAGGTTRALARKALTLHADTARGNLAAAGDVLVLLPPTVANCRGAASMVRRVECSDASGDAVAAGTLTDVLTETEEDGTTTTATVALHLHHMLRLDAGDYVVSRHWRSPARYAIARRARMHTRTCPIPARRAMPARREAFVMSHRGRCGGDVGLGWGRRFGGGFVGEEVWGRCGVDAKCSAARAVRIAMPVPCPRQVCHAFSVDMYAVPDVGEVFDNLGAELALPPPPPPPDIALRCPSSELFIGTDALFRQQHGVHLRVRYPLDGVVPASVTLAEGGPAHFDEAVPGDLLRLLPACELGCGTNAGSAAGQHFPFQALDLPHTCQSARGMPSARRAGCSPPRRPAHQRPCATRVTCTCTCNVQHVHAHVHVHVRKRM